MKQIIWFIESFSGFKILDLIFLFGFLISGITCPFVAIFIARRFDPLFKYKTIASYPLGFNQFSRSSWYASLMLYYNCPWLKPRPNTLPYTVFKDYNLWQNATIFERILACAHIIPGVVGLFAALLYYVHYYIFKFLLH